MTPEQRLNEWLPAIERISKSVARRTGLEADDLAQEGSIGLLRAADRGHGPGFDYLHVIQAMYHYVDRELGRRDYTVDIDQYLNDLPADQPSTETIVEALDQLRRLPPREREILLRRELLGETESSIARSLGVSRGRFYALQGQLAA